MIYTSTALNSLLDFVNVINPYSPQSYLRFSDVFRGYRNVTLGEYGLKGGSFREIIRSALNRTTFIVLCSFVLILSTAVAPHSGQAFITDIISVIWKYV